jgi:glucose/arabinose dehydrogenase
VVVATAGERPLQGYVGEFSAIGVPGSTADAATVKSRLIVPAGYGIGLFARDVPNARMVRMTAHGDVLVASPGQGPASIGWRRTQTATANRRPARVARRTRRPNGLDLLNGYLYVAEQGKVGRVAVRRCRRQGRRQIRDRHRWAATGGNHWKKTIRFGPDGLLSLNVGSSCNVCMEEDDRRAAMLRYTPRRQVRRHLRDRPAQQRGFDWRADGTLYAPTTGAICSATISHRANWIRSGKAPSTGWPFANGDRVPDPDLGAGREAVIDASIPAGVFLPRPQCAVGHGVPAQRQTARRVPRRRAGRVARDLGIAAGKTATRWSRCTGPPTVRSARAIF